jgi:hypothetical protein
VNLTKGLSYFRRIVYLILGVLYMRLNMILFLMENHFRQLLFCGLCAEPAVYDMRILLSIFKIFTSFHL